MKISPLRVTLAAIMLTSLAACESQNSDGIEDGQIQLTIATVPADVRCIQLTASNGSTVVMRSFDVVPSQSASVSASGLPTGTVTLTEAAYAVDCPSVSAQTPLTWVSQPVVLPLQPGQVATVSVELTRPGAVSVTNTFNDHSSLDGGTDSAVPVRDGSTDRAAVLDGRLDQAAVLDGRLDQAAVLDGRLDQAAVLDGRLDQAAVLDGRLDQAAVLDGRLDQVVSATVYQISAGSTNAATPFAADQYYSGGTGRTTTNTITISGVTNPAPAAVYQSERYGAATYTFPSLTAGAAYKVRLHFAELYWTATGQRVFNVVINGATALSRFDIYAAAGAANRAVVREITTTANSSGQIVIAFSNVTDNASIEGIEIIR